MMYQPRKFTMLIFLVATFLIAPLIVQAADFPTKPITLIVPYPAGGATDVVLRPLAEAARKHLGQPVIVENRGGGGGAVGVGSIVGKKPDGYLLCVVVTSLHRNSYINKLPFDTVKDVTPIIRLAGYLYGILVRPDSQFKTLKELIEYARAKPGKILYMASGVGTGGHIAMEELAYNAGGIKFSHIPSKGDQESTAQLLGGHIDAISTTSGWIPQADAGNLRLLATYGEKRTKRYPNVPTVVEVGYKVIHNSPIGIVGPKDMPKEIVKILHDAFKKSLDDPSFLSVMGNYEMPVMYQNTEDFTKYWSEAYIEAGEHVRKYMPK
jgi:tripartite-type tricarboxylate transporter receptor subunit TctC